MTFAPLDRDNNPACDATTKGTKPCRLATRAIVVLEERLGEARSVGGGSARVQQHSRLQSRILTTDVHGTGTRGHGSTRHWRHQTIGQAMPGKWGRQGLLMPAGRRSERNSEHVQFAVTAVRGLLQVDRPDQQRSFFNPLFRGARFTRLTGANRRHGHQERRYHDNQPNLRPRAHPPHTSAITELGSCLVHRRTPQISRPAGGRRAIRAGV